ncbi:MAG: hypothetical protein EAZ53_12125 [Bacteroidetes bacterium]|nr:MAG: hypothetical protein EAZ53_12125 [Bacteroidota bacterium]
MFNTILNIVKDSFKAVDFEITSEMNVNVLQNEFKKNFGLSLRIYEVGTGFAPGTKKLSDINQVQTNKNGFSIKATWKIKDVSEKFSNVYNLKVKVADINDEHLIPNDLTLGAAARGEYTKPKLKSAK